MSFESWESGLSNQTDAKIAENIIAADLADAAEANGQAIVKQEEDFNVEEALSTVDNVSAETFANNMGQKDTVTEMDLENDKEGSDDEEEVEELDVIEVQLPDGTSIYYNEKTLVAYDADGEQLGKYDPKTQKVVS